MNRPANAVLDLSFYRAQNLPLELTAEELQILNALEWQSYLHAHDRERRKVSFIGMYWCSYRHSPLAPDCPRPEFCESALSLDQLIQHGLLQVQNYEPFETLQYVPDHEEPKFKGKRMATLQSSAPEGSNSAQPRSVISQPESSSSGAHGGYHRVEDTVPRQSTTPDLVANTRPHAPLIRSWLNVVLGTLLVTYSTILVRSWLSIASATYATVTDRCCCHTRIWTYSKEGCSDSGYAKPYGTYFPYVAVPSFQKVCF